MGSRTANNEKAAQWVQANGARASQGTFADAASFGEIVFNCTAGTGSLEALRLASGKNLKGKILVDISNPLDFSKGMPPTLSVCNTDSLAEQIQSCRDSQELVRLEISSRHGRHHHCSRNGNAVAHLGSTVRTLSKSKLQLQDRPLVESPSLVLW